ncbi:MerR family transcriptional regulator [Roseospira goensis]|uniref:DNA-binding transcriptional MerR regulator n=1 Tax=Roseospira goensis TaxID=391922 RepID=A0A7W6S185_9PROT|nr:DNA-binding transcriptional MerR regulator [Roseospira goensis]
MAEGQARDNGGRRSRKSDAAFRTISEVATELDVPQHVLRFWETKFSQIRPMKRGGGRRYYRPEDVVLLTTLRDLLYREGYTIKGVQKLLRDNGAKALVNTVKERQERSEGGTVGPVGLALAESRASEDTGTAAEGDEAEALTPESPDAGMVAPEEPRAEAEATPATPAATGLTPAQRAELTAIADDLAALRGLLTQALEATRPPSAPPDSA